MNPYQNKKFSILGDSISTLERYSTPEYAAFYTHINCIETGIFIPSDTWWGQVIEHLGGQLLVNDSFSGSTVCRHPQHEIPSYACSRERTSNLGTEDCQPDVIMVFMGMNDWGQGTSIYSKKINDLSCFSCAYRTMLKRLKKNYPSSELWCLTLPTGTCSAWSDFRFPYRYGGVHIEAYCETIRTCAKKAGARLIDLYGYAEPYDTIDGFHPTPGGMQTIAQAVLRQLEENPLPQKRGQR